MPKAINYKANSIVYFRGDTSENVYILKSGKVSLNYNDIETGQEMHDLIQTGEFFGVKSALGKYPREETAVVLTNATMIAFSVPEFEQIALQNTRIIMKMLKVFSNQLRRIHKQVRNLLMTGANTNDPESGLFKIGQYYLKSRKFKQAVYALRRYLTYYPSGKYASEASSLLEAAENGTTGNMRNISHAAPVQTGTQLTEVAKAYYNAVSLFSQEQYGEALKEFQKIIKDSQGGEYEAKAQYESGRCFFNLNKFDQCIKHYTMMIQKYPKHPDLVDALFYVGNSYERLNNKDKATGFYKKILSMAREDMPVYRKSKKALKKLGE
ncbi:MAG: Crp/Fnr family transcriptional regulator [Spirochaetes bacterium]|nr:MAG: Crp/Fnr family transcriptional regulator [Spirochaetota bacterium]